MLILITGASKNGKSKIAENIITSYNLKRFYIATMQPYSDEAFETIERHRKIRSNKDFKTIEKYTDIQDINIPEKSSVLLECICNLCANEMFGEMPDEEIKNPADKILSGISKINKCAELFVIVTSQVGDDGIIYSYETMEYIKNMGEINHRISEFSDVVIEAVFGIPVVLKGELPLCLS